MNQKILKSDKSCNFAKKGLVNPPAAKRGILAVLVIGAGLAGWAVFGQSRQPTELEKIQALFAATRPHLETILGEPLSRGPSFQPLSREQLARLPHADAELYLRLRFPHLEGAQLYNATVATRRAFALAVLARYCPEANVIYVVRDPLPLGPPPSPITQKLLQFALVHETVCAQLDAHRRQDLQDLERLLAWQALVHGKALEITQQVARQIGGQALVASLVDRFVNVPDDDLDQGLRTVTQAALRQRHWAMTQGREFVRYLADQKIEESLVFTRPPRQIEWIKRPEKYVRALRENRADLRELLVKVESTLPHPWTPFHQAWTADMVLQVAGLVNEKPRAEKCAAQWQEGRTLVWSRKDNSSEHIAVSVARFTKPADARNYFNFAVDLQRKQDLATGDSCGLPFVVVESKSSSLQHEAVEEAILNKRLLQARNGQAKTAANTLLARQNDSVLEITWHGAPVDETWAQEVISKLLAP